MSSLTMPFFPFVEARTSGRFDGNPSASFGRIHAGETADDRELPDVLKGPSIDGIAAHHTLDRDKQLSTRTSSGCQVDFKGR